MREDRLLREKIGILVDALFESRLDAEGAEELEELVTRDPLACRYYFEMVGLYEGLSQWSRSVTMDPENSEHQPLDPSNTTGSPLSFPQNPQANTTEVCNLSELDPESIWGTNSPKEEQEEQKSPILGFLGDCFDGGISFLSRNIVLVIVLLPLLAIGTIFWMNPVFWESPPKNLTVAARVEQTIDCNWKLGGIQPGIGSFLIPGQKLELDRGLVELKFVSRAKVILEGPAEFTIVGDNASKLALGRLAATVPEGAEGFTVKTPSLDVVDMGTEFGVAINTPDRVDVHVFKGLVEMEAESNSGSHKKVRLNQNEAVVYNKATQDFIPVPIDTDKFVRNLDYNDEITANLKVANASFESPDIQMVSEFQSKHGSTLFRPIDGWKMSDQNQNGSRVAMYQISPYTSSIDNCDVGPDATDGRQVAVISLGVKGTIAGAPRSNWIYQSLGTVGPNDIGKTLQLTVDAGPRSKYAGLPQGKGTVFAGFALEVTETQKGIAVGQSDTFRPEGEIDQLHRLEATAPITLELIGKELFILLAANDDGSTQHIDQYHFDNVQLSVVKEEIDVP